VGAPETANITSNPFRVDPRDPNYDVGPEDAERDLLECCIDEIECQINAAKVLIARGDFKAAEQKLNSIATLVPV
jgi:hypothetical protein